MNSAACLIVRVPVLGGFLRKYWLVQTLRMVSLWLDDGVSQMEAFRRAKEVAPNLFIGWIFEDVAKALMKGDELWEILGASGEFPPFPLHPEFMDKRPESVRYIVRVMTEAYEADLRFLYSVFSFGITPVVETVNLLMYFVPIAFTGLLLAFVGNP
jgi:hypothetical protein